MVLGRDERKIHSISKEGTSVHEKDVIVFRKKVGHNPKIECDGVDQINHSQEEEVEDCIPKNVL